MEKRFQPVVYNDYDYLHDDDDAITVSDDTYLAHYLHDDFQYESDSVDQVQPSVTARRISTKVYCMDRDEPLNDFSTSKRISTKSYTLDRAEPTSGFTSARKISRKGYNLDREDPAFNSFVTSRRISTKGYNKLLLIPIKSLETSLVQKHKRSRPSTTHNATRCKTSHQNSKEGEGNQERIILADNKYHVKSNHSKRKNSKADKMKMVMSPNEFKEKFGHSSRDSFDVLRTDDNRISRRISVNVRDEPHGVPITSDEDEGRFLQDIYEDSNGIYTQSEYSKIKRDTSSDCVEQKKQSENRKTFGAKQSLQTIEEFDSSLNNSEINEPEYAGVYKNNKTYIEEDESFTGDIQTEESMSKIDHSGRKDNEARKPSSSMTELMRKYSIANSWTPSDDDQYHPTIQEKGTQEYQPERTNDRREKSNYDQVSRSLASKKNKFSNYDDLNESKDIHKSLQTEEIDGYDKRTGKGKGRRDSLHVSELPVNPTKQELTGSWEYAMERLSELNRLEKNHSKGKMMVRSPRTSKAQSYADYHQQEDRNHLRTKSIGAVPNQFDASGIDQQTALSNKTSTTMTRQASQTKEMKNRQTSSTSRKISRKITTSYKGNKQQRKGIKSALMETYPDDLEQTATTSYEQQQQQYYDENKKVTSSTHQQEKKSTTKKTSSSRRFSIMSRKKSTGQKSSSEKEYNDLSSFSLKDSRWKKIKDHFIGPNK